MKKHVHDTPILSFLFAVLLFILPQLVSAQTEGVSINAEKSGESSALLHWTTKTEINSSHFEIERSTNAMDWVNIGMEKAAGNSSSPRYYSMLDENVCARTAATETFYYRLKIVDLDGAYNYSPIRCVTFDSAPGVFTINAFPNPARSDLMVEITGQEEGRMILWVLDHWGRVLYLHHVTKARETYQHSMDVERFPAGMYFLYVKGKRGTSVIEWVKID
jgi:hypothetical protein